MLPGFMVGGAAPTWRHGHQDGIVIAKLIVDLAPSPYQTGVRPKQLFNQAANVYSIMAEGPTTGGHLAAGWDIKLGRDARKDVCP